MYGKIHNWNGSSENAQFIVYIFHVMQMLLFTTAFCLHQAEAQYYIYMEGTKYVEIKTVQNPILLCAIIYFVVSEIELFIVAMKPIKFKSKP